LQGVLGITGLASIAKAMYPRHARGCKADLVGSMLGHGWPVLGLNKTTARDVKGGLREASGSCVQPAYNPPPAASTAAGEEDTPPLMFLLW